MTPTLDNYRDEIGVTLEGPIAQWQKQRLPEIEQFLDPKRDLIKPATFKLNDQLEYGFVICQFRPLPLNPQTLTSSISFVLPPTSPVQFTQEQINILSNGLAQELNQYLDKTKQPSLTSANMQLTKITDPDAYLNLFSILQCKPIVALALPPGMLAIAAAISAISDEVAEEEDFEGDLEFTIQGYKEELGEIWESRIIAEDGWDFSQTFDIRVIRDTNDYNVQINRA